MGDLGYTSSAQDGLQICYNQIDTYIKTLTDAIVTPHGPYQALPQNQNEEQLQLNHGLLQIENEFYSAIRPKRITESGEAPVKALSNRGIEYLEIRCLDINPFTPLGIDDNTIALVDTFLLACALTDSPLCDADSRAMDSVNTQRVLNAGRDPKLQLLTAEGSAVPLTELALPIIDMMHEAAVWLDGSGKTDRHTYAVEHAKRILTGEAESPSARVIRELKDRQVSYSTLIGDYSQTWNDAFKRQAPSQQVNAALADEAIASLRRQREVEASDTVPFSTFLRQFYAQYE
jgi:glutamate--cysteine ligase